MAAACARQQDERTSASSGARERGRRTADARLHSVAKTVLDDVGLRHAEYLLGAGAMDEEVKEVIERNCGGRETGFWFRKQVLNFLRTEVYGSEAFAVKSAWEVLNTIKKMRTGSASLDSLFGGGISVGAEGSIVEVAGRGGCGKSQLCMQLALMSAMPEAVGGLDSCSIYVNTEGHFATARLLEIERGLVRKLGPVVTSSLADKVILEQSKNVKTLLKLCSTRLPWLVDQNSARMVVIDSVAAPFSDVTRSFHERQIALRALGNSLQLLARTRGVLVFVANQVSDIIIDNYRDKAHARKLRGTQQSPVPSLGLTWRSYKGMRYMMSKVEPLPGLRRVEALGVSHPVAPKTSALVTVTSDGICDPPE